MNQIEITFEPIGEAESLPIDRLARVQELWSRYFEAAGAILSTYRGR